MILKKVECNFLFETSWEVCNKIGGIYTVLSTKAKNLQSLYKDRVIFIGPDVWTAENPCPVFKESVSLLKKWKQNACLPHGIGVRVGRWEVPGRPIAILVDFKGLYDVKNSFYGLMWEKFGVDSLHAYGDYDEACAFSLAAGMVIENFVNFLKEEERKAVIAHFDEWTTGMGLLYVKNFLPEVATIFTTHATSIGRSICGNGKNLYQYFRGYNGDQMARELNMEAKHSLEKVAAMNADCFTTVSDITAAECEQLLDKRPDVVTPNGFEDNFVPKGKSFATHRKQGRQRLLEVANALTGAELGNDTFIVATSGRCEYRNKGLDVFIDSIDRLADFDNSKTVLAFVMVPAWVKDYRKDLAHNLSLKRDNRLENPVITHNINNPGEDAVFNHIQRVGFHNIKGSRTLIVYVPCYLNGDDGIFDKSYYSLLVGMDATVFPSYYEPWGYTPLESVAFGVPTVTTSLSGFGRWTLSGHENDIFSTGVKVIERNDTNYSEVCERIAATLRELCNAGPEESARASENARKTSHEAAWDYFIEYYVDAFGIALANASARNK